MNKTYIWILVAIISFAPSQVKSFAPVKGTLCLLGGLASAVAAVGTGKVAYDLEKTPSANGYSEPMKSGFRLFVWPAFVAETALSTVLFKLAVAS